MITSISKQLYRVQVPKFLGQIQTKEFDLETLKGVPQKFKASVRKMIEVLPIKKGIAFLTVDGKKIRKGISHRRGGKHIDGNFIPDKTEWGGGGGNGWKVGGDGRSLPPEIHKLSYESKTGGMLIVSDYSSCKGWNGKFNGKANVGGDCSHIKTGRGFKLKSNTVYYGNSQFIHESLPLNKNVHRTLIRINLDLNYPVISNL